MRRWLAAAALAASLALAGCLIHVDEQRGLHWHTAIEAVIPEGHLHNLLCGHCFSNGRWYYHPDHVHGLQCGHVFREGFWTFDEAFEEGP